MSKIKAISRTSKIVKPVAAKETKITFDAEEENKVVFYNNEDDDVASMEWEEETLTTCSTVELFGFSEYSLALVPKEIRIKGIREALKNLPNIEGDAKKGVKRGYTTYMFTLINSQDCNYMKEALEGCELFTLVKSFVNSNSGNVNDLYISNGGGK